MQKKTKIIIGVVVGVIILLAIVAAVVCVIIFVVNKSGTTKTKAQCTYGYQGDYCDECGLSYASPNLKIVGGTEASAHSWPSIAYVLFRYSETVKIPNTANLYASVNQEYLCGATLITRNTLITAAHCIKDSIQFAYNNQYYTVSVDTTVVSRYKVYLGVHDKNQLSDSSVYTASVSLVTRHVSFDSVTKLNDIGVIKLSKDVPLTQNIQLACLPNPNITTYPTSTDIPVYAAGWGTLTFGGSVSNVLMNVKLTLYNPTRCSNVIPAISKNWNSQICAGNYSGYMDTCQGDSGGPLFVLDQVNNKTKYVFAGITSYGSTCAEAGKPGIYTRVSYYSDWITTYS